MTKLNETRPKLSFAQANFLCRQLLPIGDESLNYVVRMNEAGFKAILPRIEFVESFAENSEEVKLHRQCVVEDAKERLGQPHGIKIFDEDFKQLYFSPILQKLRERRDLENGCPVRELGQHYNGGESVWRMEIDPCRRRLVQHSINHKEGHEARFNAICEIERQTLKIEAEKYATGIGKDFQMTDKIGRLALFEAVMTRDAASLGFFYDKSKFVFSKSMTDDWHLCWSIKDNRTFFLSPFQGRCQLSLQLRSKKLTGSLAKVESGELLEFRYRACMRSIAVGYAEFFNLDEFERCIKANLFLYSLMAEAFEAAIKKALADM